MKVKKIILTHFKGVNNAEYLFDGNSIVSGANGSGKTTIADAWFWLFTDKDYSLKSNPEIHPQFMDESEPSVEAICDIDGKEVSFRKIQKDARTKKSREKGDPIKIKNTFEINSVPMSQTDFDAKLNECGIDPKQFLLLTHPEIFMGQKTAECRKILFGMVNDITDLSIAQELGFPEVSKLLENYKLEEIIATQKRSKKESETRIEAIPNQIIGLEKAKTVIDEKALSERAKSLQKNIDTAENDINENPIESISNLNDQMFIIKRKMAMLNEDANRDRIKKYEVAKNELNDIVQKMQTRKRALAERESEVAEQLAIVQNAKREYSTLGEKFATVKSETFDESSNVCAYCGQNLPSDRAEENRKRFAADKQKRMNEINHAALVQRNLMRDAQDKATLAEESLPEIKSALATLEHQIDEKEAVMKIFEVQTDATGTSEYKNLESELIEVEQKIKEHNQHELERRDQLFTIRTWKEELLKVQNELATVKINARIDEQIAELRIDQKLLGQSVADAEKILYQVGMIGTKKNTLMEEQVNSHFTKVRFKLFEQLKNGDFKDCCVPVIDEMVIGQSANTAREILAKLDILKGLQEFYKTNLPVFLDGSESLDNDNSNIDVPYQLIMLKVTDDPELKIS